MDTNLATMWVQFAAKGLDTVQAGMDAFHKKINDTNKSAELLKQALDSGAYARCAQQTAAVNANLAKLNAEARKIDLEARFGRVGAGIMLANEKWGQLNGTVRQGVALLIGPAAAGFALITGTVMGFVRAGLAGSVEGYRLQLMFSLLSKEIAGIFLPVVERVTAWLQRAVNWFQALSRQQQQTIMITTLLAAGVLGVTVAVGGLIIAGIGLITMVLNLTAAMAALDITLGGIPILIGVIVTGLAALGVGTAAAGTGLYVMGQKGNSIMEKLSNAATNVLNAIQPLIDITLSWLRITESLYNSWSKFTGAITGPFGRLLDRFTAGKSALEVWADILDRIANFVEDKIVPIFNAWSILIDSQLNKYLQAAGDLIERVTGKAGGLLAVLAKISPLLALAKLFYDNTRASEKKEGHDRPSPMDAGFESGEQAWKRVAVAVSKIGATKGPEEKTADNTEEAKRIAEEIEAKFDKFLARIDPIIAAIENANYTLPVSIVRMLVSLLRG